MEETHKLPQAELRCFWLTEEVEEGRIYAQKQCPLMVDLGVVEGLILPFLIP